MVQPNSPRVSIIRLFLVSPRIVQTLHECKISAVDGEPIAIISSPFLKQRKALARPTNGRLCGNFGSVNRFPA